MDFIEVKVFTTTQGIDAVTARLMDAGITGFIIEDSEDFSNFLADTTIYWDYVDDKLMELKNVETNITFYIADNEQGSEMLSNVRTCLDSLKAFDTEGTYGRLFFELSNVREEDWANNWKQYFKPLKVGEKFVVKPSWETYDKDTSRHIIEID
ncbi:MAG: 50S ribosomal protein L11 methyltransferase, partial [Clostridiales bacterium]|nr:50S ribosomal protein L11 methyltransferase [Clostridiales bacterium]